MKRILIAASLAAAALQLQGCMAIPAVVAANSLHKAGVASYAVTGDQKRFASAFRRAVQKNGGVVQTAGPEYGVAVFTDVSVKVEYQALEGGGIQVMVSSSDNVSRAYDFNDSISRKAEAVANELSASGYTVGALNRQRGI